MDHIVGHVVRRGMEAHSQWRASNAVVSADGEADKPVIEIPAWGAAVLAGTVVAGIVTLFCVSWDRYGVIGNH